MEFEQIIKRIEWLDEERRKDKDTIAMLETRLANLEGNINTLQPRIKEVNETLTSLAGMPSRLDQFEAAASKHRAEFSKQVGEVEKRTEELVDKQVKNERQRANRAMAEIRKTLEPLPELQRTIQAGMAEETRLKRAIADVEKKLEEIVKTSEDTLRATRVTDENRRQDAKRIADLQGEISASRKRTEEIREKIDLNSDGIRRVETRLNELLASEAERRQSQAGFIEQQARLQIERDQSINEWKDKFDKVGKQSEQLEAQLVEWDAIQRAVKRAQEVYEEITQKFERRINEVSEMQRLAEDRFRQEWITFKSEDQKRWTSFTLSQAENQKDTRLSFEKLNDRLTALEDLTQTQQDVLHQSREAQDEYLQGMAAQIHELLSAYERILGKSN